MMRLLPTNVYSRQVLFLTVLLAVLIISFGSAHGTDPRSERELERVVAAWDLIRSSPFAAPGEGADLVEDAINGMLGTLDPHTHFLDEDTFRYMRQEQQGEFYGIGISFDIRDGTLTVISPIEGTPAWDAGIRAGDRIVRIEGESTQGITTTEVINTLRGKRGSRVTIAIQRHGEEEIREVTLVRGKIPLKSVRTPQMIDGETGYVRIDTFAQSTEVELKEALAVLRELGAKRLILDLRFNSGGLLTAAQEVAQRFLVKGTPIVLTRGRLNTSKMDIEAEAADGDTRTPLIVLVNEYSASASEIVAGAIQDHDRGLIVGETTFGKGLVGSLLPLSGDTALQITTAQYYTASGRFIQKPYDIEHRRRLGEDGKPLFKGWQKEGEKLTYHTDNGREVQGGGGIAPDVEVKEPLLTDVLALIDSHAFDFAVEYIGGGAMVSEDMVIDDGMVDRFLAFLDDKSVKYDGELLRKDIAEVKRELKHQLIAVALGADAGYLYSIRQHPMVEKALELFPELPRLIAPVNA
ncbi:S41 family peptidase [bacterium]|nr:S41 family peptidase [candidate division CSSED10-310 bacterium]